MKTVLASMLLALSLSAGMVASAHAETTIKQLDAEGRGGHQK